MKLTWMEIAESAPERKGNRMEKGNGKKYYDMDSYIIKLRERLTFLAYEADEESYDEKETKLLSELLKWVAPRVNYETMNKLSAMDSFKEFMQTYEFRMYLQDLMEKVDDDTVRKEEEAAKKRKEPIEYEKDPKYIECPRGEARAIVDLIASRPISYNKGTGAAASAKNTGADLQGTGSGDSEAKILNFEEFTKDKAVDGEKKNISKTKKRRLKATMRGAAAAIVVLAVFLGGGAVGAYAERETGFFHFFRHSDKGVEMITSPEVMDAEIGVIDEHKYSKIGEMPEKYAKEVWMPSKEALLDGLEFDGISVIELKSMTRLECHYTNPSTGDKLEISKRLYDNRVMYHWMRYDSYDYIGNEIVNDNIEIRKYSKKNDDGTTYIASFFVDKKEISIVSNISIEYSLQIAKEYIADLG